MRRQTTTQQLAFCADALPDVEHAVGLERYARPWGEDFKIPLLNLDRFDAHTHEDLVIGIQSHIKPPYSYSFHHDYIIQIQFRHDQFDPCSALFEIYSPFRSQGECLRR